MANKSIQAWLWYDNPDTGELDKLVWPDGWAIPPVGNRIELMLDVEVEIVQVQWSIPECTVNIHVELTDGPS